MSEERSAEKDVPLMGSGRPTIYGDYIATAIASHNSAWHVHGDAPALTLCGKHLSGSLRRMHLHVSLLECSSCMRIGGE